MLAATLQRSPPLGLQAESHFIAVALALLTIPFFLSLSARTIVWRAVLGLNGPLNALLMHLGVIDQPLDWLLFSEFAVVVGTIVIAMFMPMISIISKMSG